MIRTNISNLKNRLSHYLRLVRAGEVVEIMDRKTPLARIEAVDGIQGADSGDGWLQRMMELGIITAPKTKVARSVFTHLDQVVSEKGRYTGALEALKEEREESR
jgi:antitoxin (DNA-binding transcriptional repressor) of toxin-antitoxin stability system